MSVKSSIARAFGALGLEVRRRPTAGASRASMSGALRQLSRLGFKPKTVIDVGAVAQTQELYQAFPTSAILLVKPLMEFEPFLRKICATYNAQYVLAAAGSHPGKAILNVHPDMYGSSLLKEVEGASVDGTPREVPVVTVDELCATRNLSGPFLIKADVQGAELQVLGGATRTLAQTEAVVLEVTLFGTMIGGPQLYDVVDWMRRHGFVIYDVFDLLYRPFDRALCQANMVFVREVGRFRRTHVFATPEHRQAQWRDAAAHLSELGIQK